MIAVQQVRNKIAYIPILIALLYCAIRAMYVPLSHEEALTYLHHVQASFWGILTHSNDAPLNNHLLNSLLIKLCTTLFGSSEFVLRMPALLGLCIFSAALVKLSTLLTSRVVALVLSAAFFFDPYLLDVFSCARGYGFALGFLLWSFMCYYDACVAQRFSEFRRYINRGMLFLTLATLSQGSFAIAAVCMSIVILWLACSSSRDPHFQSSVYAAARAILVSFILLGFAYAKLIGVVLEQDLHPTAATTGFLAEVFENLLTAELYGQPLIAPTMAYVFVAAALALIVLRAFLPSRTSSTAPPAHQLFLHGTLVFLAASVLLLYLLQLTLGIHGSDSRTSLFLIVPFWIALCISLKGLSTTSFRENAVVVCGLCIVCLRIIHFTYAANISYFFDWPSEQHHKEFLAFVDDPRTSVSAVGVDSEFYPALSYYSLRVSPPLPVIETHEQQEELYSYYVPNTKVQLYVSRYVSVARKFSHASVLQHQYKVPGDGGPRLAPLEFSK